MLIKITPATTEVMTLARAKERCNVLHDDWDDDIRGLIQTATRSYERETGTILQPSTWEARYHCWESPYCLDAYPIRDVLSVKYLDTVGGEITVDPATWYFDRTASGAELRFTNAISFPSLYDRPNSVRIRFTAGFNDPAVDAGSDSELTLPPDVIDALCYFIGTRLEIRESLSPQQFFEVPNTFKYLVSQAKIYR